MVRVRQAGVGAGTLAVAIAAVMGVPAAQAGGLWLNHYGDFAGARASAGAAAGGDEATTIIHNPATAAFLEGSQTFVSGGIIVPDVQFEIAESTPMAGTNDGGDAGLNAPAASFAYVHGDRDDRWRWGVYSGGFAGAGLEYDADWVGRFQATDVEILVLAFGAALSYRVTDSFSIGIAPQVSYATLDLGLRVPSPDLMAESPASIDGDDIAFSFNVGAVWQATERTRIGLDYQSEVELDFDGELQADAPGVRIDSNTEIPLAQRVRLGVNHQLNDDLSLWLTLGWDDWSALDAIFVSLPEQEGSLEKNWDDTYQYGAGIQYRLNERWEIAGGISYDTNPVDARDRTADLPIDRQMRYNLGARYQMRDDLRIGSYINYTDLGDARIQARFWSGEYSDNSVIEFVVNVSWLF